MGLFFKKAFMWLVIFLLRFLDLIFSLFQVMVGLKPVHMEGIQDSGTLSLLDVFLNADGVTKAFLGIFGVSVVICAICAIFAIVKQIVNLSGGERKPIGRILGQGIGAHLITLVVAVVMLLCMNASNMLLAEVNSHLPTGKTVQSESGEIVALSFGAIMFDLAIKTEIGYEFDTEERPVYKQKPVYEPGHEGETEYIIGYEDDLEQLEGYEDVIIGVHEIPAGENGWKSGGMPADFDIYTITPDIIYGTYQTNMIGLEKAENKFIIKDGLIGLDNFNFLYGFLGAGLMTIVVGWSMLQLVKRLFDIVILFLTLPMVTATIPLDDGAKFKLWRETVISKTILAYSSLLAINVFLIVIPIINTIAITGLSAGAMAIFKLFLFIGGGLSCLGGQLLISRVFGTSAEEGREMTGSFRSLLAGAMFGGKALQGIKNATVGGTDRYGRQHGGALGAGKRALAGSFGGAGSGGGAYTRSVGSSPGSSAALGSALGGRSSGGGSGGIGAAPAPSANAYRSQTAAAPRGTTAAPVSGGARVAASGGTVESAPHGHNDKPAAFAAPATSASSGLPDTSAAAPATAGAPVAEKPGDSLAPVPGSAESKPPVDEKTSTDASTPVKPSFARRAVNRGLVGGIAGGAAVGGGLGMRLGKSIAGKSGDKAHGLRVAAGAVIGAAVGLPAAAAGIIGGAAIGAAKGITGRSKTPGQLQSEAEMRAQKKENRTAQKAAKAEERAQQAANVPPAAKQDGGGEASPRTAAKILPGGLNAPVYAAADWLLANGHADNPAFKAELANMDTAAWADNADTERREKEKSGQAIIALADSLRPPEAQPQDGDTSISDTVHEHSVPSQAEPGNVAGADALPAPQEEHGVVYSEAPVSADYLPEEQPPATPATAQTPTAQAKVEALLHPAQKTESRAVADAKPVAFAAQGSDARRFEGALSPGSTLHTPSEAQTEAASSSAATTPQAAPASSAESAVRDRRTRRAIRRESNPKKPPTGKR